MDIRPISTLQLSVCETIAKGIARGSLVAGEVKEQYDPTSEVDARLLLGIHVAAKALGLVFLDGNEMQKVAITLAPHFTEYSENLDRRLLP